MTQAWLFNGLNQCRGIINAKENNEKMHKEYNLSTLNMKCRLNMKGRLNMSIIN